MNKSIHLFSILLIISTHLCYSQDTNTVAKINQVVNGYYQTINLDEDTPCGCDKKTDRTHALNKGLIENDVLNYSLHAYKFSFGSSVVPVSKLFKAIEEDASVYKISMKEWQSFMLLTTDKFDSASFEAAASKAFLTFTKISPVDFLKSKNTSSYNEYVQKLQEDKKSENQQH